MSGDKNFIKSKYRTQLENDGITNLADAKSSLKFQRAILKTMAELVEFRDNNTGGHIERTQLYLGLLLGALIRNGLYESEIDTWDIWLVINSAQLHDVGKIAVPDSVLQKPGGLSIEEFEQIKRHTGIGEEVINRIEKDAVVGQVFLEQAKIFAASHHEKWDGSGYPKGLKETDIPLQGRLMAIVDVYDALVSDRPYKKAFSHEEAVDIIAKGRGTHFDPILVDAFLELSEKFSEITAAYKGL